MGDTEHFVQFYEADGFLLNSLSGFIGGAINQAIARWLWQPKPTETALMSFAG